MIKICLVLAKLQILLFQLLVAFLKPDQLDVIVFVFVYLFIVLYECFFWCDCVCVFVYLFIVLSECFFCCKYCCFHSSYGTQVYIGSNLWVQMSL